MPDAPIGAYLTLLSWWQHLQQLREILGDSGPKDVQVDVEVVVDEPVAHPSGCRPRDLWVVRAGWSADLFGRLADDLDQFGQPESEQFVFFEVLPCTARRELDGLLGCLVQSMAFSAASRRWRSRMTSSGGFIQRAGLGGDLVAEVPA